MMKIRSISLLITVSMIFISGTVLSQNNHDFYTKAIRSVAPHVPEQPEGRLINNQEYVDQMVQWATRYNDEYVKALKINPAIALFEPLPETIIDNGKPLMLVNSIPPWHNPAFMRYPVTKQKPVFIGGVDLDNDSTVYRNKLQHWHYLFDTNNYKKLYGKLPKLQEFPKPIHHPDELGEELLEKERKYYPEFYKEK